MKRVKIMLTTIAVVAIVAGALAFKVSKMYSISYCTAALQSGTCGASPSALLNCPNFRQNSTTTSNTGFAEVCTTDPRAGAGSGFECKESDEVSAAALKCITDGTVRLKGENQ